MPWPAERLPTFDELYTAILALPPGLTGEILGPGEFRVMGRPGGPHRWAGKRLVRDLGPCDVDEGGTGWWFEVEAEIRFPDDRLYVPDVAAWRADGRPPFVGENPIPVLPDWTCEILSRSTQRGDRARKLPVYAAAAVAHVWVMDPAASTIEVYDNRGGRAALVDTLRAGERRPLAPFGLEMDADRLWR